MNVTILILFLSCNCSFTSLLSSCHILTFDLVLFLTLQVCSGQSHPLMLAVIATWMTFRSVFDLSHAFKASLS